MKTKPAVSVSRASLWHIPLAFLVAMALVPVLFALLYSFKSLQSIYGDAGLFTSGFTLDNYRDIARQLPIVQITLNTLTVAVLVTACKLLTLILRSKENYTLSLAMQLFSSSEAGTEFTTVMAMAVISMLIPVVLYLIFQRYIMSTFASSGIKG